MVIYITKWLTMTLPTLGFPNIIKGSVLIKIISKPSFGDTCLLWNHDFHYSYCLDDSYSACLSQNLN